MKKTILNNCSRAVLLNFLDTDLYERQGKAISNFEYALPEPQSDLAQEITKDPYNFDFVAIRERGLLLLEENIQYRLKNRGKNRFSILSSVFALLRCC